MKDVHIARGDRLGLVAPYLQQSEPVLDHGLTRWEELERALGDGAGNGFLAATDRRLLFLSERQRKPTSLIYGRIKAHGVRKKVLTAQLWVVMEDLQEATFTGGKQTYSAMNEIISNADSNGAPPMETTILDAVADGLMCRGCRFVMTAQWPYCPGCARTIDWPGSASAVDLYNARTDRLRRDG